MDTCTQLCNQLINRYCFQNQEHKTFGQYCKACSSSHFAEFRQTVQLRRTVIFFSCFDIVHFMYILNILLKHKLTDGIKNMVTELHVLGLHA